jgi:hypothetical protein
MAVIVKKAEKVRITCESLQPGFTFEQGFVESLTI